MFSKSIVKDFDVFKHYIANFGFIFENPLFNRAHLEPWDASLPKNDSMAALS
jgi:hypothetical protein